MKSKIVSTLAVIFLAVGILFVSIDRNTNYVNKSLAVADLQFEVISEEMIASPTPKIEYYLVYPGILPDHPLYKIKMIRDRLWLWLTPDLPRRSELLLLSADKRLGAGKVLIEGNKSTLGITTLWKAEKYLDQAVNTVIKAQEKGLGVQRTKEKIKTAALKHEEILTELKEKTQGEGETTLEEIINFSLQVKNKTVSF